MKLKFEPHYLQPSVLEARFRGYTFQLFYNEENGRRPYLMTIVNDRTGIEEECYTTRKKAIDDALPLLKRYLERQLKLVVNHIEN